MALKTPRPRGLWKAMTALVLASCIHPAWACTTTQGGGLPVRVTVDIPLTKANAPRGELLSGWHSLSANPDAFFVDGCDRNATIAFQGYMFEHDLRPAGTVWVGSGYYTAFEYAFNGPSPLFVFQHSTAPRNGGVGGHMQPIHDLASIQNPGFTPPAGGVDGRSSWISFALVARGQPMRAMGATTMGRFVTWPTVNPSLKMYTGLTVQVNIPRPTCSLVNQTVPLIEARAVDLPEGQSHTGETPFDIAMNCDGFDASLVRITIRDALDPSSNQPWLTPTAESTTAGIALQIGHRTEGSHEPHFMGYSWTEKPREGATLIPLFARYLRTTSSSVRFRAGDIGAKATLTLTYL